MTLILIDHNSDIRGHHTLLKWYTKPMFDVVSDIICRKLKKVTSNLLVLRLSYFCTLFFLKNWLFATRPPFLNR